MNHGISYQEQSVNFIWARLLDMASELEGTVRANHAHPRTITKDEVRVDIQRLIGARLLLSTDPNATQDNPAWAASTAALDTARTYGFEWK